MPPTTLWSPTLKLSNRASTAGMEEQNRTAIRRSHLPQLRPETLVIRIPFASTFPRQPIDLLRTILDALFSLQLQIELHSLLQSFASGLITLPGSGTTTELEEDDGEGEGDEEAEDVREREVVEVEGGGGEEDGEGVEEVGEVGGDEECSGEEDEDEYEEVESGRWRVLAEEGGIRVRVRV